MIIPRGSRIGLGYLLRRLRYHESLLPACAIRHRHCPNTYPGAILGRVVIIRQVVLGGDHLDEVVEERIVLLQARLCRLR